MTAFVIDTSALVAYLYGESGGDIVGNRLQGQSNSCYAHAVVYPGKMSLADCFGIALARRENAVFLTADHHEMDKIAHSGTANIEFIR